jgi:hypothetical protein
MDAARQNGGEFRNRFEDQEEGARLRKLIDPEGRKKEKNGTL